MQTDWASIYQTPSTPAIQSLPWFHVIGNHDIPTPGGVDAQIAYSAMNKNWNLPSRYYSADMIATGVSVRLIALNTNPCVGKYTKTSQLRYGLSAELLATATSQYIGAQMQWLNATLVNGKLSGCGGKGCTCARALPRSRRPRLLQPRRPPASMMQRAVSGSVC